MKQAEKNALSRQRIRDAAMRAFSEKGYDAASLNAICAENEISKGILYHYFKDKDALYLLCAADCFDGLTAYLRAWAANSADDPEIQLRQYFDARLRYFAEHPVHLGIFLGAVLYPPAHLTEALAEARRAFDYQNAAILTALLGRASLRQGLTVSAVVDDFRMYMDYFNVKYRAALVGADSPEQALREHEERCHRQLTILLYGVLEK